MSAALVWAAADRLGVRVALVGDLVRLFDVPMGEVGDALVDLVRAHRAAVVEHLMPTPWRWWQCPCGHEVRDDQASCPLAWCSQLRSGPIYEN